MEAAPSVSGELKTLEKRELFLSLSLFGAASHLFVIPAVCDTIFIRTLNVLALCCWQGPALPGSLLFPAVPAAAASFLLCQLLVSSGTPFLVPYYWVRFSPHPPEIIFCSGTPLRQLSQVFCDSTITKKGIKKREGGAVCIK